MEDGAKRLLATLWGKSRGYVFISTIRWHGGKYTFEGDKAFMWPTERHALSAHVDEAVARGTDVYFTPGSSASRSDAPSSRRAHPSSGRTSMMHPSVMYARPGQRHYGRPAQAGSKPYGSCSSTVAMRTTSHR